ncbi:hypothetical protein B0H66DRAFT_233431 [Apodospora peruviana]|uniref:RanBD1 domain-containing protein n=1 Tax=Apodospora peruviana TaxID=516989 RepID=A0AAE0M433_9PEZI|nr:hypothetical protein B0H66DRAFT_233431 [Apodospora peruviana]
MADDPHNLSDISDTVDAAENGANEDAETTAARRELKQTSISEKAAERVTQQSSSSQEDGDNNNNDAPADKTAPVRTSTTPSEVEIPKLTPQELKEQVSSPKKKRAHDELDEPREEVSLEDKAVATKPARTARSEPEKKRPRDRQADEEARSASGSARSSMEQERPDAGDTSTSSAGDTKTTTTPAVEQSKTTSGSAFASSGFAKLASSSTSPFGALGGTTSGAKPSLFGTSSTTATAGPSGFGAFGGGGGSATASSTTTTLPSAPPKLSFGAAGGGSTTGAASPFGSVLNGNAGKSLFRGSGGGSSSGGSAFGSAFGGSALGDGNRLGKFGQPGNVLRSDKPAKPFGAPESDAEDESDDNDDRESGSGGEDAGSDKEEDKKEKSVPAEEKKKHKLQKIVVDDGEGDEVTLLAVRVKMFQMENREWKERGAGMLKVNVPKVSIELDDAGNPDPSSFDASVLDDDDDETTSSGRKNVRLIIRQDHTLRVILNTPIIPAMSFLLTRKLKAATVLFTAFVDGEAKAVQVKMSDANATIFTDLMALIKKQLADV